MFPENKLDSKITPHENMFNSHFKMPVLAQSNDRKNTGYRHALARTCTEEFCL